MSADLRFLSPVDRRGCNGEGEETIEGVDRGFEIRKRKTDTLSCWYVTEKEQDKSALDGDPFNSDHSCVIHLPGMWTLVHAGSSPWRSPQPYTRRRWTVGGGSPKPDRRAGVE